MFNLSGQRFGRLLALDSEKTTARQERCWRCVCDCGNEVVVRSRCLRRGDTKSCGCLRVDTIKQQDNTKHGYYNSPTYHSWEGMKQRCTNPNYDNYRYYGALGITYCKRWEKFESFLEDMGERPPNKSLDRINPYGNYEPHNCRWATSIEQANNKRSKEVKATLC